MSADQADAAERSRRGRDPAFLFYSGDFLAATFYLRDADVGRLIRLLCMQHLEGHLEEQTLLRVAKKPDSPCLGFFLRGEDGLYYNERLESEVVRRREYARSRRRNLSGKEKNSSLSSPVAHMGGHMASHMAAHMETGTGTETENKKDHKKCRPNPAKPSGRPDPAGPAAEDIERMKRMIDRIDRG